MPSFKYLLTAFTMALSLTACGPSLGPATPKQAIVVDLAPGVTLALRRIDPGEFKMGSPESEPNRVGDEDEHMVKLTRSFDIGETAITVRQFRAFVDATGYITEAEKDGVAAGLLRDGRLRGTKTGEFSWKRNGVSDGDEYPVVNVTWNDAQAFCKWLASVAGREVRLPTEAEREYACRAGTTGSYPVWLGAPTLDDISWHPGNSGSKSLAMKGAIDIDGLSAALCRAHPVATKCPNPWGLYDMVGNVQEWCQDRHGPYKTWSLQVDPIGHVTHTSRVIRGASWGSPIHQTRSAYRDLAAPNDRSFRIGFRIVMPGS